MEQFFYWGGGIIVAIISYFLRTLIEEFKENKREMNIEIEKLKVSCADNKNNLGVLKNDHENKYQHLNSKLDELYSMLKDLIVEVKDINRRIK
jgi:peptidoglycan hydrolase CwlO-like protein